MDYSRQIETASRLITKYGGQAKLYVTTTVTDPSAEWNAQSNDTEQSQDVIACWLNFPSRTKYGQSEKAPFTIQQGDLKVLVAAKGLTLEPNLQGRITRMKNGVTENWTVVGIDPLGVDGQQMIMYTLQVRQ
jgi:hypothetical protein